MINFICKLPTNKPSVFNDTLMSLLIYCLKLANIMNGCLEKKMFLGNLENTQITPRHKNNNKGNKENYRPFSILLKVLERLIH